MRVRASQAVRHSRTSFAIECADVRSITTAAVRYATHARSAKNTPNAQKHLKTWGTMMTTQMPTMACASLVACGSFICAVQ